MELLGKRIPIKRSHMKLRFTLLLFCLLGVGLFAQGQNIPVKPKKIDKVEVIDGKDALPITVRSTKKSKVPKPPPPPPVEVVKVDPNKVPPPPPPPKLIKKGPMNPPPPPPVERVKIKMNEVAPPPPPKPKSANKVAVPDAPTIPDAPVTV